MPSRIIRDSCRTSPTLDSLSDGAERMFWRLTTVADDHGRFETDPRVLLSSCFPLRVERIKIGTIQKWLDEMRACGLLTTYVVNGRHYGFFNTWEKYQRRRAKESKYPAPTPDNICGHPPQNAPGGIGYRVRGIGDGIDNTSPPPQPAAGVLPPPDSDNHWGTAEDLITLYNQATPDEFPAVETLSEARRKKAKQYLAQFPDRDFWVQVFTQCRASPFLRGLRPGKGHEKFRGSLDWLLSKGEKDGIENCVKVYEGKYGET